MKKLNLGCGYDIRPNWVNMDIANIPGVDVVHDINIIPFPFEDNTFDEVYCQEILEHVEYVPILKELRRILKVGGELSIRVPHFTSRNNYVDPTHKKRFSVRTFDFFVGPSPTRPTIYYREYYFDFKFSEIKSLKLTFSRAPYNYLIMPFIGTNMKMLDIYEQSMLSRIFPAENLEVTLVK